MSNFQLPPIGSVDITVAKKWLEDGLYYEHPLYCRWRSSYRRGELYDAGFQWLKKGLGGTDGTGGMSQWASIYFDASDPNYIPTPVFNEGFGSRTNESARLGRPNYRPVVQPKSDSPNYKVKRSAEKATDALRHRLRVMEWDKQAYLMYYHIPVYGGAWLKSEWEQRWDKTTMAPGGAAMACPHAKGSEMPPLEGQEGSETPMASKEPCPFILSDPSIPIPLAKKASWVGGQFAPFGQDGNFHATNCPTCEDHPPLQPFQSTMEEAATGKDALGRSLGTSQPLGDWLLTVRPPYGMHPKNLGFMMAPGNINEWREVHVETLDWVAMHYPEKAAKVDAERPDLIAKYDPNFGAPDIFSSILDSKLLKDCVRVMEWHKKPWMERFKGEDGNITFRLNEGRSLVIANNVILLDAAYMIASPTDPNKKIGRVEVDYVPWEVMDGGRYLQGMSLWQLLFDPQDNANEIRSQAQSVRQRMAVPLYWALKSQNLEIGTRDGIPGRFVFGDIDPEAPNMTPQIINNTTIADGIWRELEDTISSLEKYAGNVEVEKGQVPPNVEAALAIQYLKTYAGEKREPRIARIKESLRRLWKHGLELMTAFYIEPREVSYENEAGDERWAMLSSQDIAGETSLTVESEADFDDKARNQELVLTLVEKGILQPQTDPALSREIARVLEAPESLFEVQDIQKDGAQREYIEFQESQRIPVVDPTLDDHGAHYRQHGIDSQSDWFRDLEERAEWDSALKILGAAWEPLLMQTAMTPGPLCLQERIFQAWMQTLQMAAQPQLIADPLSGQVIPAGPPLYVPPQDLEALQAVLKWRAHSEDHRLTEQVKQMQAMTQPILAAPGGQEGPAGTQPTAAAPAEAPSE